ncbi:MAG: ElyC/SanA/YdcF family protein [Anaerolineaceae bacterium]
MKLLKKIAKWVSKILFFLFVISILIFGLPVLISELYAKPKISSLADISSAKVAIVFGAGLSKDGSASPVLRDRVETAANLYFAGKVEKLLMSGDNRFVDYNEPGAMLNYAISLGVPSEDIVLDYAGRRTYDTCYRAKHIFQIDEAILVTQRYHLPRALVTCNGLGLKSTGVAADLRNYSDRSQTYWKIREIPATLIAFTDVWLTKPLPVLGQIEPIFPKN